MWVGFCELEFDMKVGRARKEVNVQGRQILKQIIVDQFYDKIK